MEKRVLLAVFLSFLVLFVYQSLFIQPETPSMAPDQAQVSTAASQSVPPPASEIRREQKSSETLSNEPQEISETEYQLPTPTIADSQMGFRPDRGTDKATCVSQRLIESAEAHRLPRRLFWQ